MKKIILLLIFKLFFSNLYADEENLSFYLKKSLENNLQLNAERKKTLELYEVGGEYALDKLDKFIDQKILMYKEKRDFRY